MKASFFSDLNDRRTPFGQMQQQNVSAQLLKIKDYTVKINQTKKRGIIP